jgi:hypothetical protein
MISANRKRRDVAEESDSLLSIVVLRSEGWERGDQDIILVKKCLPLPICLC